MKKRFQQILTAVFCAVFLISGIEVFAQQDRSKRPSPPDTVSQKIQNVNIEIAYSRPSVKGRQIWGTLVPYDKVWRTGANEATTFKTDKDIKIEGKVLPAGRYALFTIPGEKEWTIIFNKNADQMGAYNYDSNLDVLRVKVKPSASNDFTELFTIRAEETGNVSILWEKMKVDFKVSAK